MTIQISIRLSPELHSQLSSHVASIRPETSLNKYITYLIEQDMKQLKLIDTKAEYKVNDQ